MDTRASRSLTIWVAAVVLVMAFTSLALAGCDSSSNSSSGSDALALTAADNGKSYTVQVGDTVTVTLEGNPTTGYAWQSDMSEADSALLTMVGTEPLFTQTETASDVVGAGGTFTFDFEATAAGQVELKLKYWRSFEAQDEPLETFSVNLTIE